MGHGWMQYLDELMEFLDKHDPNRKFSFKGELRTKFQSLRSEFQDSFIMDVLGSEVENVHDWVKLFKEELEEAKKELKIRGALFSKEFKSFLENPLHHLRKKLFNYTYDLLRNKVDIDEFLRVARAAITTSLRTNMRTLYQNWVVISILRNLADYGVRIVYPEYGYLLLERSGRQRIGVIPPNCIVYVQGKGYLSLFIEVPRPLSWEDTDDLKRIWKLYVALRPDMLIYRGKVLNILDLNRDPPILRPNVIIECKELDDWYMRIRDVRGPFARPLSAEEWRSRWIRGLWDGLAEILGVSREEAKEEFKKKAIRLHETKVVELYREFYKPDLMYLVSRALVTRDVIKELKAHKIKVLDNVGFDKDKLRPLVDDIVNNILANNKKEAKKSMNERLREVFSMLREYGIEIDEEELMSVILEYVVSTRDSFIRYLRKYVE